MSEDILMSVMQLQRKIIDPQDVFDQANGCRGMLLAIEALFSQGKLSEEARDWLEFEYSSLLSRLWMSEFGKQFDESPSKEIGPTFSAFDQLRPKLRASSTISEDAIAFTLQHAIVKRNQPNRQERESNKEPRSAGCATDQNQGKKQQRSDQVFCSAKQIHAIEHPEVYKTPLDDIIQNPEIAAIGLDVAKRVLNEMMTEHSEMSWDEIAGLQYAKNAVREMIVWPLLRPDIFTGAREPPKGMLLFGPPGTGKTLIGKCIAAEAKATFFSVSASTLVSKWIGESNLLVRALFAVARAKQPSVIFLDELDSLLSARGSQDHKHDRQLITELFVQLDGAKTYKNNRVIFIGATNRPFDLDDAARRRLVKRLYIALPDQNARQIIIANLFNSTKHTLTDDNLNDVARRTHGE